MQQLTVPVFTSLPGGIYPYLVSPLDSHGAVNEKVLSNLIDNLVEAGVSGLSPLGSTGEVMYLTEQQRLAVVEATVSVAAGRVPVVPGVASFSTADAVAQAKRYELRGVAGLVVMLQAAFPVSESGVVSYFRAVAEAVSCPIVLYTNPALLGTDLSIRALTELSQLPNVRYIKDATGNTGRILTILNHFDGQLGVFSASAHIPLLVFKLGAVGWMAGPACVVPELCVNLFRLHCSGRQFEALELQRRLWSVNEVFQRYSLAACIKAALEVQGYAVGPPVAPQQPLGKSEIAEIRAALEQAGASGLGHGR